MFKDEDGIPYFIDTNTEMTTYDDPRVGDDPKDGHGPLPPLWEKLHDEFGAVYFVNRQTQETTWDDPRFGQDPKDGLGPLPRHWEAHYDEEGNATYVNMESETSTHDDPRLMPHGDLPQGWESVVNSISGVASFIDHTADPPTATWLDPRYGFGPLSPEWEELQDPESHRTYFVNKSAAITVYDDPRLGKLPLGYEMKVICTSRVCRNLVAPPDGF